MTNRCIDVDGLEELAEIMADGTLLQQSAGGHSENVGSVEVHIHLHETHSCCHRETSDYVKKYL